MPYLKDKDFPSLHAPQYLHQGHLCSIYEIGCRLSAKDLQKIIHDLNAQGYPIKRLEFFEYGPSDTLRHLYVWLQDSNEGIPYFQLDLSYWQAIVRTITKNCPLNYSE